MGHKYGATHEKSKNRENRCLKTLKSYSPSKNELFKDIYPTISVIGIQKFLKTKKILRKS